LCCLTALTGLFILQLPRQIILCRLGPARLRFSLGRIAGCLLPGWLVSWLIGRIL
jgi:hypothetical protein